MSVSLDIEVNGRALDDVVTDVLTRAADWLEEHEFLQDGNGLRYDFGKRYPKWSTASMVPRASYGPVCGACTLGAVGVALAETNLGGLARVHARKRAISRLYSCLGLAADHGIATEQLIVTWSDEYATKESAIAALREAAEVRLPR